MEQSEWKSVAAEAAVHERTSRPYEKEISVPLTPAQRQKLFAEEHELRKEIDRISAEKKEAVADLKCREMAKRSALQKVSDAIDLGTEKIEVMVRDRFVYATGNVETLRVDTGEVVDVRAMTLEERQMTLDITGDSEPAASSRVLDEEAPDDFASDVEVSDPESVLLAMGAEEHAPPKRSRKKADPS